MEICRGLKYYKNEVKSMKQIIGERKCLIEKII